MVRTILWHIFPGIDEAAVEQILLARGAKLKPRYESFITEDSMQNVLREAMYDGVVKEGAQARRSGRD